MSLCAEWMCSLCTEWICCLCPLFCVVMLSLYSVSASVCTMWICCIYVLCGYVVTVLCAQVFSVLCGYVVIAYDSIYHRSITLFASKVWFMSVYFIISDRLPMRLPERAPLRSHSGQNTAVSIISVKWVQTRLVHSKSISENTEKSKLRRQPTHSSKAAATHGSRLHLVRLSQP